MRQGEDRLVIEAPAEPAAVGAARLFATSVARTSGIDDEFIEDIRLAISEAVTERVRSADGAGGTGASVRVTAIVRDASVEFEVAGGSPTLGDNREVGLAVIRSLFPEAVFDDRPPALRFTAPRRTAAQRAGQSADRGA